MAHVVAIQARRLPAELGVDASVGMVVVSGVVCISVSSSRLGSLSVSMLRYELISPLSIFSSILASTSRQAPFLYGFIDHAENPFKETFWTELAGTALRCVA